eukprot:TRINITY_DN389_c0_g1_i2.p1 TRINITY_DN389_c0_g1~~TRINITY_DN389_c0_g1_i2.p1  ORF type:complete len:530 (+),score=177.72 TRINITY_DN389_c0_g1_i2:99-1592(+)
MTIVLVSPDSRFIVCGFSKHLRVFDTQTQSIVQSADLENQQPQDTIRCIDFDAQSQYCAVSGDDKNLVIFKTSDWSTVFILKEKKKISALRFSPHPSSHLLVSDRFGDVHAYRLSAVEEKSEHGTESKLSLTLDAQTSFGHFSSVGVLEFGLNGKVLISGDADERLRVCRWPLTYDILSFCLGHSQFISSVAPVGQVQGAECYVSGSGDCKLILWRTTDGVALDRFDTTSVLPLPVSDISAVRSQLESFNAEVVDVSALSAEERAQRRETEKQLKDKLRGEERIQRMNEVVSCLAYLPSASLLAFARHNSSCVYFVDITAEGRFQPSARSPLALSSSPSSLRFATLPAADGSQVPYLFVTSEQGPRVSIYHMAGDSALVQPGSAASPAICGPAFFDTFVKEIEEFPGSHGEVWFKSLCAAKDFVRQEQEEFKQKHKQHRANQKARNKQRRLQAKQDASHNEEGEEGDEEEENEESGEENEGQEEEQEAEGDAMQEST